MYCDEKCDPSVQYQKSKQSKRKAKEKENGELNLCFGAEYHKGPL